MWSAPNLQQKRMNRKLVLGEMRTISPCCCQSLNLYQALAIGTASYLVSWSPLVTVAALKEAHVFWALI